VVAVIRHHVLLVQTRATSKISKAPGMTKPNANWKNGVMCIIVSNLK
jgi:hypothetical protein